MKVHILTVLFFFLTTSCKSQIFSERERKFTDKLSLVLNGASVKYKKGVVTSSNEGRFFKIEIFVEEFAVETEVRDEKILFASSIPAYLFVKDSIENNFEYRYIDVVLNMDSGIVRSRYTRKQLMTVDSSMASVNGFIYGIKERNKDSLTYYSDPVLFKKIQLASFLDDLNEADRIMGKGTEINLNGFRFDKIDNLEYVYFSLYLKREKGNHEVLLWVNPETKKINAFDL